MTSTSSRPDLPSANPDERTPSDASVLPKRPYESPVLKDYGNLLLRTQGTGGSKSDGSVKTKTSSERHLKRDITRLGQHSAGFGIYAFRYIEGVQSLNGGAGLQVGCMIDEALPLFPEAVSVGDGGRLLLDYSALPPVDASAFVQ